MPKPVSDLVPRSIHDEIAALGLSGLGEYAERKNLRKSHLYSIFSGNHSQVRHIYRLAAVLNLSPEELNTQALNGNLSAILHDLKGSRPWQALAMEIGCSDTTLRNLAKESGELKALKPYQKIADGLGWSLARLGAELGIS